MNHATCMHLYENRHIYVYGINALTATLTLLNDFTLERNSYQNRSNPQNSIHHFVDFSLLLLFNSLVMANATDMITNTVRTRNKQIWMDLGCMRFLYVAHLYSVSNIR